MARFQVPDPQAKTETGLEASELEGDTLDPQTGLFYRSSHTSSEGPRLLAAQPPPSLSKAEAEENRPSSTPVQQTPPPLQLHSKPQTSQPASSTSATPLLTKKILKPREVAPPKPQVLTPVPKDKPLPPPFQAATKATTPSPPTKTAVTPQLPKLQQAPTSHHRPLHSPMSHPPPLQAHHPVSTEKAASSQVSAFGSAESWWGRGLMSPFPSAAAVLSLTYIISHLQPIITQSATVTKITFGTPRHPSPVFSSGEAAAKLIPESSSGASGDKPSVSDILKISMIEAEIDPSTEPMVVDSSSDCGPLGKALEVQAVSGTLDAGQFISSSGVAMRHSKPQQFGRMQGLPAESGKDDLEVIEVRSHSHTCDHNPQGFFKIKHSGSSSQWRSRTSVLHSSFARKEEERIYGNF